MTESSLDKLLQPRSIAVVGATERSRPDFVIALRELGFRGEIFVVNPGYDEVHGLKSYENVKDIPGPVDYAISAIPAAAVPGLIDDCAQKGVKIAHLYSARFGETGRPQDAELETEVLRRAVKGGVRVIGPNCMGLYYPKMGIGWTDDFPTESGSIGMASQSSYAVHDLILLGASRGMRFSKVIGYGNALDFNECDFLEYLASDPETAVILMYVEGVKDGKRFLSVMRKAALTKPVIVVKGGKGEAGARAAASHTASLAGSADTWKAAVAQAGAIPVESLDEMIDYSVSFSYLKPIAGSRVGIAGSGGGPSVLGADQCEVAGLKVVALPDEIREQLKARNMPMWDWVGNPVDMSISGGAFSAGELLHLMAENANFDLLIAIMGEPHYRKRQRGATGESFLQRFGLSEIRGKPLLAVVPDKSLDLSQYDEPTTRLMADVRTRLLAARIPFYPTMTRAARSAKTVIDYYQRKKNPGQPTPLEL